MSDAYTTMRIHNYNFITYDLGSKIDASKRLASSVNARSHVRSICIFEGE
jgi:hypothetical protein